MLPCIRLFLSSSSQTTIKKTIRLCKWNNKCLFLKVWKEVSESRTKEPPDPESGECPFSLLLVCGWPSSHGSLGRMEGGSLMFACFIFMDVNLIIGPPPHDLIASQILPPNATATWIRQWHTSLWGTPALVHSKIIQALSPLYLALPFVHIGFSFARLWVVWK